MTLDDVHAARTVVQRTLQPTPLLSHALLNAKTGLNIRVKHENHNPTSAFKVRGGLNLIASLTADERRGVITASTGNHGQSIALACQREGVPCTIAVPIGNNPDKNAAMRALGATVVEVGRDFDQAREYVRGATSPQRLALRALGERANADRRRCNLRIGGVRGMAGCQRHPGAHWRRQWRLRLCSRENVVGKQSRSHRHPGVGG